MNANNIVPLPDLDISEEAVIKLTKDLKEAVTTLTHREVRYLIDTYYQLQKNRTRAKNQLRALKKFKEPHGVIEWIATNCAFLERQVKAALERYAKTRPMCIWAMQHYGIAAVISAGMESHLDVRKAANYGHFWSFAGMTTGFNSPVVWKKGEKRPWNASLKTLCWKMANTAMKFQAHPDCFYGHLFAEYKRDLMAKNERGEFKPACIDGMARVAKNTMAWPWYAGCYVPAEVAVYRDALSLVADYQSQHEDDNGKITDELELAELKKLEDAAEAVKPTKLQPGQGVHMLSPGHVNARALRYVAKMFLSHWWEEAYKQEYGKLPPEPYPLAHLGHTHKVKSPVPTLSKVVDPS